MYDYVSLLTTIRHFEVDFVNSTAKRVGQGPTVKSLDSIQAVEDSIYYMAQVKKTDNGKGVLVLEIAGDLSLVEKRFILTNFNKSAFASNDKFKKDIFHHYRSQMMLVGLDSAGNMEINRFDDLLCYTVFDPISSSTIGCLTCSSSLDKYACLTCIGGSTPLFTGECLAPPAPPTPPVVASSSTSSTLPNNSGPNVEEPLFLTIKKTITNSEEQKLTIIFNKNVATLDMGSFSLAICKESSKKKEEHRIIPILSMTTLFDTVDIRIDTNHFKSSFTSPL